MKACSADRCPPRRIRNSESKRGGLLSAEENDVMNLHAFRIREGHLVRTRKTILLEFEEMRYLKALIIVSLITFGLIPALGLRAQQRGETFAWAPVPSSHPGWTAPNKPHWKLAIVYVPKGMWHRAHHGGTGTSTRLAMNGYPEMLHNYQPNEELR